MKNSIWQVQEAKNKLSEVIDRALNKGPQIITRRGVEAVIVLSYPEYRKLLSNQTKLTEFFRESPLHGVTLDVKRDPSSWRRDTDL